MKTYLLQILFVFIILSFTSCDYINTDKMAKRETSPTATLEESKQIKDATYENPIEREGFYLDTIISIKLFEGGNNQVLDGAFEVCGFYENKFSKTIDTSEISRINNANGKPVIVSDETIEILKKSIEYSELSRGEFDVTVGAITELWDFDADIPELPKQEDIDKALKTVDYKNIKIEGNQVTLLNKDTKIDLGAIAKGYIADKLKDFLVKNGATGGIINLGGNVLTIGSKQLNDESWKIGVRKPFGEKSTIVAIVDVKDKSVVSSGIYERYFEMDGKIYHHILDPDTGYPVENDVVAVTVISDKSGDGDALSTITYTLGLEKGSELVEKIQNVEVIYIMRNGEIKHTSGIGKDIPIEYTTK